MFHRQRSLAMFLILATLAATPALAQWHEDFESYPAGGGLHGMGGWAGWNGDAAFDAVVSDLFAFAGSQSAAIAGTADIVQSFSGYTAGIWALSTWMYIPDGFTGETYFIALNTYVPNGDQNWSVQIRFTGGQVVTDTVGGESLPWITGQWVELRLEINLESDLQTFYYGGTMLYQASWTEGVSGAGALELSAIDLFANGATEVYYDEFMLTQDSVATEARSWSGVKNLFN